MTQPVSVRIHRSTRPSKKLMAVFTLENGRTRTVHFGAAGASDYTTPYDTHEVRNDYCLVFKYKPREHDYPRISLVEAPKRGSCAAVK